MCELFGANLKRRMDLRNLLSEFYSHSNKHPHGWGLFWEQDNQMKIMKESVCANESSIIADLIDSVAPQQNLLAHIRYATIGSRRIENCHPFSGTDNSGRKWTLIHNGTVYSSSKLMKYLDSQTGDTDSERIFMYLMDKINEAIEKNPLLDSVQRFAVIDNLVKKLSPRNKLNLMIYDEELLYVHKNMRNTLSYKQTDDGVVLSTEPLEHEGWQALPMCRAIAFKDGEKIYEGEDHGREFIPTLDYITEFDAMNI